MAYEIDETYDFDPVESGDVVIPRVYPKLILNRPERNPIFTGREGLLDEIHNGLTRQRPTAITQRQAISGLGGIGKTQLAIEYTYRYAEDYRQIFWVNAESNETIIQEYVKIAKALELPERDDQNQQLIVEAVKYWLETHSGWLLILDNADDLEMAQTYFPDAVNGHLLLTTRAQAFDSLAKPVQIDYMTLSEGVLFLLSRVRPISIDGAIQPTSKKDQADAEQIVKELGGLPLALDQAGAYIERNRPSLENYLKLYQELGVKLLKERGGIKSDHPESVVKTFLIAFNQVENSNATAVNLLRLCAFFAAEDIPESLIFSHLPHLIIETNKAQQVSQARPKFGFWGSGKQSSPTAAEIGNTLNVAFGELFKLSLIRRANGIVSVHRLVQAVLKEYMPWGIQHKWAGVAIRILSAAFPNSADESTWFDCEKLLPHALSCVQLITIYSFYMSEASQLLNNVGVYLTARARFDEAQPVLERALKLRESEGEKSLLFAESLHNLALLYERQDRYAQAEQHLNRAFHIREKELGKDHPDTARSINSLAQLYRKRNKLAEAEPLYQRALEINRTKLGLHHPATLQSLKNLATLYVDQQKYADAEALYQQALDYSREKPGSNLIAASIMQDFAELYKRQGKLEEAEKLYEEALRIRKEVLKEHPDVATSLNSLAELRDMQGNPVEAERLFNEALTMREKVLGPENSDTANSLYSFAGFYQRQGNLAQTEQYYKRALSILENKLELNNPLTMQVQEDLARLYEEQQRYKEAETVLNRGLNLRFKKLKPDDPKITQNLQTLTTFYANRPDTIDKQERLLEQAFQERSKKLTIYHPLTKQALDDLMQFYQSQHKTEKREQLLKQVFTLRSQALTGNHPETIEGFKQTLQDLMRLYDNNPVEKEHLYIQAFLACKEQLGISDPLTTKCFNELMKFYARQGDGESYEKIKRLYYQEFNDRRQALKKDDPTSIQSYLDSQHEIANIFEELKKIAEAEQLLEQTLETCYKKLGVDHARTIQELHSLVQLYESHKKVVEGIRLYKQDVEICKNVGLELEHPRMIESYNNLARFCLEHISHAGYAKVEVKRIVKDRLQQCEPKLADNYIPFDRKPLSKEYIQAAVHSLLNAAKLYSENYANKDKQERAEELFRKALKVSIEKLDEAAQNEARESLIEFLMKAKRFEEAAALRINATMMKKQENGQQE